MPTKLMKQFSPHWLECKQKKFVLRNTERAGDKLLYKYKYKLNIFRRKIQFSYLFFKLFLAYNEMCKFYVYNKNIPITLEDLPYYKRQLPLITLSRSVLPILKFNMNGVIHMNHILYGFHAQHNVLKTHTCHIVYQQVVAIRVSQTLLMKVVFSV